MTTIGPGHNRGPALEPGAGFRRYAWKRARRDLLRNKVPIEIVRLRVRRARELGLSYPQYASVLMGSGRDITAFLFTVDGLSLRLRRELEMPPQVRDKLRGFGKCALSSFAPSGEDPEDFRLELQEVAGVAFATAAPTPEEQHGWDRVRQAVRCALDPLSLPGNAVVMIGVSGEQERWAAAGKLAKFLPAEAYFDNGVPGAA